MLLSTVLLPHGVSKGSTDWHVLVMHLLLLLGCWFPLSLEGVSHLRVVGAGRASLRMMGVGTGRPVHSVARSRRMLVCLLLLVLGRAGLLCLGLVGRGSRLLCRGWHLVLRGRWLLVGGRP